MHNIEISIPDGFDMSLILPPELPFLFRLIRNCSVNQFLGLSLLVLVLV